MQGEAPRKRNRNESGRRSPSLRVTSSSWPSVPCSCGDLGAVADGDAVALEVADQVVGHRLAQVGAAVQQRHERAAARQPDRGLGGRVAAADDRDAGRAAALGLGRAGGVEDADALVGLEVGDRQAAVLGAGGQHDGARRDLLPAVEPHDVAVAAGLEREGAVRRGHARAELARLRDGARGQLPAADARREAEVVLDPPREARLPAEHRALDHERVEALGRAVDRRAQAARPAADHDEVDLLARAQLGPDPERAPDLAAAGRAQLGPAREADERQRLGRAARRRAPAPRRPRRARDRATCRARARAAGSRPSRASRPRSAAR